MKKEIIENYNNSTDKDYVNVFFAGIYILLTIQQDYMDFAEDLMREHNVMNFEIKERFNIAKKSLNNLEKYLSPMILTEEKKSQMLSIIDNISNKITPEIFGELYENMMKRIQKI